VSCGRGETWRRKWERPNQGGVQGSTISPQAAVRLRRMPQALMKEEEEEGRSFLWNVVNMYHSTQRHIRQDFNLHRQYFENLKSHT